MKYCNQCGHENPDDAHFCDGCGAHFEAESGPPAASAPVEQVPATPSVAAPVPPVSAAAGAVPIPAPPTASPAYAPPPVTPPAYAAPPAAPPTYAAPPVAPPTYAAPLAAPPVYGQPPAAAGSAARSQPWVRPAIIAAIVVVVIAVGFFAYNSFLKPAMSVADYKAQLAQISTQLQDAGTQMGDLGTQMSSGDVTSRTAAKASWDKYASTIRAGMATIRGIKPPAEFQSQHDRIIKGLDQLERLLAAMDAVFKDLVAGNLTDANYQTYPSVVAVQSLTDDPAFSAAVSDISAAIAEVQAK